jgi:hypothetical protein
LLSEPHASISAFRVAPLEQSISETWDVIKCSLEVLFAFKVIEVLV